MKCAAKQDFASVDRTAVIIVKSQWPYVTFTKRLMIFLLVHRAQPSLLLPKSLSSGFCVFSVMLGSEEAHRGSLVSVHLLSLTGLSGDVFVFGFRVECFRHRHKSCLLEIHVMTEQQQYSPKCRSNTPSDLSLF